MVAECEMGRGRWGIRPAVVVIATLAVLVMAAASAPAPASASAPPTLGLRSAFASGAGFGQVRPTTISYGGDPTSFVSRVTWRSWGGGRAIGHGTALWVWPGWCVACGGVELPATVVAFGRTSCGGHLAYSRVEWYFPSRGMTFDRRLAGEDLCGRRVTPSPVDRQVSCGRVRLAGSAFTAAHITQYGQPVSCAAARRFVAGSGAARFAGRNARFSLAGWWCGSELSMDLGGPQSFSCARRDFTNVDFVLARA
jgi:hypothetical protein